MIQANGTMANEPRELVRSLRTFRGLIDPSGVLKEGPTEGPLALWQVLQIAEHLCEHSSSAYSILDPPCTVANSV